MPYAWPPTTPVAPVGIQATVALPSEFTAATMPVLVLLVPTNTPGRAGFGNVKVASRCPR